MTKETKSERLFRHAFSDAKRAIKDFGAGKIDALNTLHDGTDERICQRTVNDIRKHAERRRANIEWDTFACLKYCRKPIYNAADCEAVEIVLRTCDKWEREEAEFKARLAAL